MRRYVRVSEESVSDGMIHRTFESLYLYRRAGGPGHGREREAANRSDDAVPDWAMA